MSRRPAIPSSSNPWAALRRLRAAVGLSDPRNAASEIQRLYDHGLLTVDHLRAANRYLRLRRLVVGMEQPVSPLGRLPGRDGRLDSSSAVAFAYENATRAIGSHRGIVQTVLLDHGEASERMAPAPFPLDDVLQLRRALDALARHFADDAGSSIDRNRPPGPRAARRL